MQEYYKEIERNYKNKINEAKRRRAAAEFILANLPELPDGVDLYTAWTPVWARGWKADEEKTSAIHRPFYPMVEIEVDSYSDDVDKENRNILADVMTTFKCILSDAQPKSSSREVYFTNYKWTPETVYYGLGEMGGYKVIIKLYAPWPPPGCIIETVESTKKSYQLICGK